MCEKYINSNNNEDTCINYEDCLEKLKVAHVEFKNISKENVVDIIAIAIFVVFVVVCAFRGLLKILSRWGAFFASIILALRLSSCVMKSQIGCGSLHTILKYFDKLRLSMKLSIMKELTTTPSKK